MPVTAVTDQPHRSEVSGEEPRVSDFMTFEEAARYHRITLAAIYAAKDRGEVKAVEVLGKTVLTKASVQAYRPRPNKRRGS